MQYLLNISHYNIYEKYKFNVHLERKKYLRLNCPMNMEF